MIDRHAAPYREDTPTDEEWLENYKRAAYKHHDTLIGMGGRPTRKVLEEPAGKAVYGKDEIRIFDEHGEPQGTVALDENLTVHHWKTECVRFEEELDRWKEFRDYQPDMKVYPLLQCTFDPSNMDQRLVKILVMLNDWREFQYYYQRVKVGDALMLTWQSKRDMKKIMDEEDMPQDFTSSSKIACSLEECLGQAFPGQRDLNTSQKQLAWIESQIPEILTESCASLEADPLLHRQLEMKLEQQANNFNQELESLEARPVRSLQPPHQSARSGQRICHWGAETTRLMQEREEWKIFMGWRKRQLSTEDAAITAEQVPSERSSDLRIWTDYVAYRRYQVDRSRPWLAGLQTLLKIRKKQMKTTPRDQLFMLEMANSWLRADMEKCQHDIHTAELRVRSAEEQLAELSSQRLSPAAVQITLQSNRHPQLPLIPPRSEPTKLVPGSSNLIHLSSSPIKVLRTKISTNSPVGEIPHSPQPSNVPKEGRNIAAKENKVYKKQPVNVRNKAKANDDTQMMEAPIHAGLEEATGDGERVEVIHAPKSDAGEVVMMDAEEPIDTCSRIASEVRSKCRSTRISRKSSLPIHQAPTSKKTRSAKKLDQTISGRVLKPAVKKPVRKAKAFTDRQNMALLSPTLVEGSPTISPPCRKSQRLRDKAAAPSLTSLSRVEVNGPSKSSRQKKPRKPLKSVGPSHSPRKEKQKLQPRALEPQQKSKQRKSKMPSKATKPSSSSRRKRLKSQ